MNKIVQWQVSWRGPGEPPTDVKCSCTVEHAINHARAVAAAAGRPSMTDDEALRQFLNIHNAKIVE